MDVSQGDFLWQFIIVATAVVGLMGGVYRLALKPHADREKRQDANIIKMQEEIKTIFKRIESHSVECEKKYERMEDTLHDITEKLNDMNVKMGKIETVVTRMEKK